VTRFGSLERLLVAIILVALATSGGALAVRSRVPQGSPEVELVFRLETVYESARLRGLSADELLDAFKEAGVTTLAIEAKRLTRLEYSGQVTVVPDYLAGPLAPVVSAQGLYWVQVRAAGALDSAQRAELAGWLEEELAWWAPRRRVETGTAGSAVRGLDAGSFGVPLEARYPVPPRGAKPVSVPLLLSRPFDASGQVKLEKDLVLGLSPLDVELARRHGFLVVAVIPNRPGITLAQALQALDGVGAGQGFSAVKFDGPSALGWPDPAILEAVGRRLGELGVPFVVDKPQLGLDVVAEAADWRGVRQQPVWTRVEPGRFPEVARERRATFLYFEDAFFEGFPADWLGAVTGAVRDVTAALKGEGLSLGRTVPLTAYQPPRWAVAVTIAGVWAAAALGALWLLGVGSGADAAVDKAAGRPAWGPRWLQVGLAVLLAATVGVVLAGGRGLVLDVKVLAVFVAGLVFPLLAIWLVLKRGLRAVLPGRGLRAVLPGRRVLRTLVGTVLAAALPAVGGLLGLGGASDTAFMLYLRTAVGIKLSLLATPVASAFLFLGLVGLYPDRGRASSSVAGRGLGQVGLLLREKTTFGQAALVGVAGLAAIVLVMRSGNFPILPLAAVETKFRSFLQEILLVRPRTKEFLVGWPALVALLYWGDAWLAATWRRWAALVLTVLASVGLLSVANTFAHLHIPVWFSLIRTANGLILGLLLGLLATVAAGLAFRVTARVSAPSEGESPP